MKSRPLWFVASIHALLSVVCVIVLYPVLWVVKMALSPSESLSLSANPLPDHVTLEHFRSVLGATDTDGHYVSFSVADNGAGIVADIATRLFEPYATNKPNGTGLGLAIAQRIALEHNGELSYVGQGEGGRGAVFRLLLPVEGPPPMSETPPPSSGPT